MASNAVPIRPERLMAELDRRLDANTVVVADASYSSIWVPAYLRAREPGHRFITPRGLAGLGWGLPLALGVQAARPGLRVVCVTGDGGFAHCWAELETAVREKLPVIVVVLNNAILGYQKHAEIEQFGQHTGAIPIQRIDHVAIARACGADALGVHDTTTLGGVLDGALASGRPTVVDVMTEPDALPPITAWDRASALQGFAT